MDLLVLKVTVTPLLMWLVSLTARKWGNLAGGLAAGLPISSGPISLYLALEHGAKFAEQAALGSLVGLAAVATTYIVYAICLRLLLPPFCCMIALSIFIILALFIRELHIFFYVFMVFMSMITIPGVTRPSTPSLQSMQPRPRWDMEARIFSSLILVLGTTSFARQLGPTLSGLLASIPVVAWPLIVFAHVQGGKDSAKAVIRGTMIGIPSVLIFYLVVYLWIAGAGIMKTYAMAFFISALGAAGGLGLFFLSNRNQN
ncbi:MAG: hypothetical protein V6Z86_02000 [Hyphomicrobiales bacterium]